MAQVTVELRKLLQLNDFELFDFPYKFDDVNFKKQIEQAVIDYYYNYEIGTETPAEFKRRFQAKWLSIIDYYNQLYNTTLLAYNPLINYKLTEALEQLATSNNTQNSVTDTSSTGTTTQEGTDVLAQTTSTDSTRTDNLSSQNDTTRTDNLKAVTVDNSEGSGNEKTSDYPQQAIAGGDFLEGEKTSTTSTSGTNTTDNTGTQKNSGTTLNTGTQTNAGTGQNDSTTTSNNTATNEDSANTTGTLTAEGTTNTNYEKTIEGLTGTSYQELIAKERQNLIRLIPMIISELKPLFILVY